MLATLSTNRAFREQARNPCNVLLSELILCHKVRGLPRTRRVEVAHVSSLFGLHAQIDYLRLDEAYRKKIYRVLHSYAEEVEYTHRRTWRIQTKGTRQPHVPRTSMTRLIHASFVARHAGRRKVQL